MSFYSLFSTNDAFSIWKILSLFHFVIALLIWNTILNNCLNHSGFYDQKKIKDNTSIHSYLIYGLIGIGVLEYFINASNCGPQIANEMVFSSLTTNGRYCTFFPLTGSVVWCFGVDARIPDNDMTISYDKDVYG